MIENIIIRPKIGTRVYSGTLWNFVIVSDMKLPGYTIDTWYEMLNWCDDYIGNMSFADGPWYAYSGTIYFKKEEHMTVFLLRWT